MNIIKIKIDHNEYRIFDIVLFKGTDMEQPVMVAEEALNSKIEQYIEKEQYHKVSHIDNMYNYYVPQDIADDETEFEIVDSIESVAREDYIVIFPTEVLEKRYSSLTRMEENLRQRIRDKFSFLLANTSEEKPKHCNISVSLHEATQYLPEEIITFTEIWQHPTEGWITFGYENVSMDFDDVKTDVLIQILKKIEN